MFFHCRTETEKEKSAINDLSQQKDESGPILLQKEHQGIDDLVHSNIVENSTHAHGELTVKAKTPQTQPRKRGDPANNDPYRSGRSQPVSSAQDQRRGKPIHPNDKLSDFSGYQDAEEEEDIDDYFQMIENAISDKKPQVIAGARKTSDIQRQLFNKESDKEQSKVTDYAMQKGQVSAALRQIDIYNQNQIQQTKNMPAKNYPNVFSQRSAAETVKEKNDLNIFEQDKARTSKKDFYETNDSDYARKDPQYIIQPPDQKTSGQAVTGDSKQGYDKLLLHELTPDTRQPSAKHYLEEHKTQPVSYEAFSSAKAMQQMQPDPRQQTKLAPNVGSNSYQQTKDVENRNQQNYYYGQLSSTTSTSKSADDNTNGDGQKLSAVELQNQKKPKPPKPEPQDWSPVSDLSPILDVSPSIEAAEQVLSFFSYFNSYRNFYFSVVIPS